MNKTDQMIANFFHKLKKNIMFSRSVVNSRDVTCCSNVYHSNYIKSSSEVHYSRSVHDSTSVKYSRDVWSSRSVRFVKGAVFCHDIESKEYMAFNKDVGEKRYNEICRKVIETVHPSLWLKSNSFEDEWKRTVPKKEWQELSKIPEFDIDVVEEVVGFRLNLG